ncbi:MAG: hypothetical protein ACKO5R_12025 [Planctomycetaceae bacterium]
MPPSDSAIDSIVAEIAPRMTSLKVVHLALVASVAVFLCFVLAQEPASAERGRDVAIAALACAAGSVALSFVLPAVFRRAGLAALRDKEEIPAEALLGPYQTGHVAGMALLEGAGLLACFALSGGAGSVPRWFVAIPLGILALMLVRFPRPRAVAEWIASAREALVAGEGDRPRG